MGTWEDVEAEQAAIEARRATYPAAREALLDELPAAWPPHPIEPPRDGWMEPGGPPTFREGVRGKTWTEFPAELVQREYAMMSILPPEGLAECLPAWLASAVSPAEETSPVGSSRSSSYRALKHCVQRCRPRSAQPSCTRARITRCAGIPNARRSNATVFAFTT